MRSVWLQIESKQKITALILQDGPIKKGEESSSAGRSGQEGCCTACWRRSGCGRATSCGLRRGGPIATSGAGAVPFEEKTWAAMRQPDDGPDVCGDVKTNFK